MTQTGRDEVLVMASAFARLPNELAPFTDRLLLMDDAGIVHRAADRQAVDRAEPAAAWYGPDAWFSSAAAQFLQCAEASPALRWLHAGTAGIDNSCYAPFVARGITITTSHGFAPGIADFVLAAVLDHWQGGGERRIARQAGEWRARPFRELSGSRWLIVGFGAIGREVARRARGFGAHITGIRRGATPDPLADRMLCGFDTIDTELAEADVVVLCASLNPATLGLGNARFFAAMKPGATLVNVGRGALLDEAALLNGLAQNRPGHAALDVFVEEPLPPNSPFWTHPQVSMTPHAAWMSTGGAARNDAAFVANLVRFLAGERLEDTVRKTGSVRDALQ